MFKKIIIGLGYGGGFMTCVKSARGIFCCGAASALKHYGLTAGLILMSALPVHAVLPEKQSDSYVKLSDHDRVMLSGHKQFVERIDQGDGNKVKHIKELNNSKSWRTLARHL